jgi:hypothetical protein
LIRHVFGRAAAAFGFMVMAAVPAHAAAYFENISGDLPELAMNGPVLNLGIGANTVSGSTGMSVRNGVFLHDLDSFRIHIPGDAVLTDVSYAFTFTNDGSFLPGTRLRLLVAPTFPFEDVDFLVDLSPQDLFNAILPIAGDRTIRMENGVIFCGCPTDGDTGWSADYAWTFTVASTTAIPEPGAFTLLGSGVVGAWSLRRRGAARRTG